MGKPHRDFARNPMLSNQKNFRPFSDYEVENRNDFLRPHPLTRKRVAPERPGHPPISRRRGPRDHTQCFAQWMSNFYNSPPGYQMLFYRGEGVYFYSTFIIHVAMQKTPRQGDPNVMYRKRHILYIRSLTCINFVIHFTRWRAVRSSPLNCELLNPHGDRPLVTFANN